MRTVNFKDAIKGLAGLAFLIIAGGCASTANIDSAEQLAKATNGQ